ncbi:MAG: FAD-dependent oxidoreductase, partial [Pseudomonadota bacterium]
AGIAGASVASELASDRRVILLEREDTPGYHTTGRSAALFTPTYGPPQIRALTRASSAFFKTPDSAFCDVPLVRQRDVLIVARPDQVEALRKATDNLATETGLEVLDAHATRAAQPLLRPGYAASAVLNRDSYDIDVDALHRAWLREFKSRGGELVLEAQVVAVQREADAWRIDTPNRSLRAASVINAAGAWADVIADMAGATPVGLVPKRRTVAVVDSPPGYPDLGESPMVIDVDEEFFLKPEAGRLLVSPADETPSEPTDARPDEWDIAVGIDRAQRAFDLDVKRVVSAWAGLRCFVADGLPVVGEDPALPGFFWLCGQGGYGIQTAPAMARLATAVFRGEGIPQDLREEGVDPVALQPGR